MELKFKNKADVLSMAVSPDGKWLAVGKIVDAGHNPSLTIWNTATWECVVEEEGGCVSSILSVSFDRHSNRLAYVTSEDFIRFFDLKHMFLQKELSYDRPHIVRYALHKDLLLVIGKDVAVLDKDDVMLWNMIPDWVKTGYFTDFPLGAVFYEEDSAVILTGNNDNKYSVYDIKSGKRKKQYPGGVKEATCLEIDKSGKYLFTLGRQLYEELLWELPDMKRLLPELAGYSSFCFHPSSRFFAVGSAGTVFLMSISKGDILMEKDIQREGISALQFSADGKLLISGGTDGRVIITDISKYLAQ